MNPFDPFLSAPGVTLDATPFYVMPAGGIKLEIAPASLFDFTADPALFPQPYVGGFL